MLWSHRPGADANEAAAATAVAASSATKKPAREQQQQQRGGLTADDLTAAAAGRGDDSGAEDVTPNGQISSKITSPKPTGKSAATSGNAAGTGSGEAGVNKQSPTTAAAQQAAAAKSQAAKQQAHNNAAAVLKTSSSMLSDEVMALKEENGQLREIEKQFWLLLDEREAQQEEIRQLKNGIRSAHTMSAQASSTLTAAARPNQHGNSNNSNNSHHPSMRAPPHDSTEAEKNYLQMTKALDEALVMLLQLDRTAASRLGGAATASAVTPGTLISRFLDFCTSERNGGPMHHPLLLSSQHHGGGGGGAAGDGTSRAAAGFSPDSSNATFSSRTAAMVHSMQDSINAAQHQQRNRNTPHVVAEATGNASPYHQHEMGGGAGGGGGGSIMANTLHTSSLSQALRVAQDEIQHMKMELDRSDLSRLQALDDVDKMQGQIKLLSQSVVELRSAYASARAQADSNARAAETVHEVTVRLAERDAEIAHLRARIAEMQRMAASGGSALHHDTMRIRAELQSRIAH